jgi:L-ascorbate oxidase
MIGSFAVALAGFTISAANPAELKEPPVLRSKSHVLDLLMIARESQALLGDQMRTVWVYEICPRPADALACPSGASTYAPYGGVRLQLEPRDTLKIRLVNQLPLTPADAEHLQDAMGSMLAGNPTNLHTHGMNVEPRRATDDRPTYGDYVFVLTYNSANGGIPTSMPGMDIATDFTDYEIDIPANHPSGLFWFHPHAHGLSLNQVSSGMAGIITVGHPETYLCDDPGCASSYIKPKLRHLILKDSQILPSGDLFSQEDPDFCTPADGTEPPPTSTNQGSCAGTGDYDGGNWFFTLNGQTYPHVKVEGSSGELWRLTNASGSVSYELGLTDPATGNDQVFQIVSIDGVSITGPDNGDSSARTLRSQLSLKATTVNCPGLESSSVSSLADEPVCATRIRMMPSSRVEFWVVNRNPDGSLNSTTPTKVVLRDYGVQTGDSGDTWPAVDLAQVTLGVAAPATGSGASKYLHIRGQARSLLSRDGLLVTPSAFFPPTATLAVPKGKAKVARKQHLPKTLALGTVAEPTCTALPAGHKRRIFFGVPDVDPDAFGMGYEEVDENGVTVPGTEQNLEEFDHTKVNICLPLNPGNASVTEAWELVNVASEDHNFHAHQTKFQVLTSTDSNPFSLAPGSGLVLHDNVPLLNGGASCDGTVDNWRSGGCAVQPVEILIPFSQLGDFVYHCHILEHEDGGMMSRIRVVANP